MNKHKMFVLFSLILIFAALILWISWSNRALVLNRYTLTSENLPHAFSGFRIAHVSDLHNAELGTGNEELLALLRKTAPDIIVITGDLVDSRRTDIAAALDFVEEAVKIAPCYNVAGNHEARISQYGTLKDSLRGLGVAVLEDECLRLERGGEAVTLIGVQDPSFQTDYLFGDSASIIADALQSLTNDDDGFRILLSHRPELFPVYTQSSIDLALCGHAHGGQLRLPLIGGLYAPNQGFFPKYDAGLYAQGETQMIVSRGIGNSVFPFRFNNRPEVILITLQAA